MCHLSHGPNTLSAANLPCSYCTKRGILIVGLGHFETDLSVCTRRNIVEYIGVGYREDAQSHEDPAAGCYLVQEYVDGGTLKQKILPRVGLSWLPYSRQTVPGR